jgi:hypothetical protein
VLSPTSAAVVEQLELDQPAVVTLDMLRSIAAGLGLGTDPKVIAARLRARGWLLPTGQRGVYEFAPGAHAGPYGQADPVLPLTVALAADPRLDAALALGTAAWALGAAQRVPSRIDVAVPEGARTPSALARTASVTTFTTHVGYVTAKGVACHRPESVLVHLGVDPSAPRSWSSVLEWLPELAADADPAVLARELAGRTRAARVRMGYLVSGLRPDLAEPLRGEVGDPVRFGPRPGAVRRYSSRWRVLDSVLPVDPTGLGGKR